MACDPIPAEASRQRLSLGSLSVQTDGQLQNKAPANLPSATSQPNLVPYNCSSQAHLLQREMEVNHRARASCVMLYKGHRERRAPLDHDRPLVQLCQLLISFGKRSVQPAAVTEL